MTPASPHDRSEEADGSAADDPGPHRRNALSRRTFISASSLFVTGTAAACVTHDDHEGSIPDEYDVSAADRTPLPPATPPARGVYAFFDAVEAETVEAITSRIMPGDDGDPGAREAGVVNYIDGKLAQFQAFAEPTYQSAPFAVAFPGESPPGPDTDQVIHVHEDELYRYGHQSEEIPHQVYRDGIAGLDLYCEERFGTPFRQLNEDQQDAVLVVLDEIQQRAEVPAEEQEDIDDPADAQIEDEGEDGGGDVAGEIEAAEDAFGDIDPGNFFNRVWTDTIEGIFADPMYGGNRGLVGWSMIGFPGAQRSYSPAEMKSGTRKRPQSMDGLHAMNPDHPDQHAPGALERYRQGVVEK